VGFHMKQCVSQCSLGKVPHDCRYTTRIRQGIVHIYARCIVHIYARCTAPPPPNIGYKVVSFPAHLAAQWRTKRMLPGNP
jgi:hypothetical protein